MKAPAQSLLLLAVLTSAGCGSVTPSILQPAGSSSAVLAAAARKVSSHRVTKRQIFDAWDTDQDGKLSLAEYETGFLSLLQPAPTPEQLPALKAAIDAEFQRLDREGDGMLTYSEFKMPQASQLNQVSPGSVLNGDAFGDNPSDTLWITSAGSGPAVA